METIITRPMFNVLSLLITVLSSMFLIRSVLELSPLEIAKISAAHLGYNLKIGKNFINQKVDTIIGFSLLLISVGVQIYSMGQPVRFIDLDGFTLNQLLLSLVFFVPVLLVAEIGRKNLISK